jgi:hypothetical protein
MYTVSMIHVLLFLNVHIPLSDALDRLGVGFSSIFIRDPDCNIIELRGLEEKENTIINIQDYNG